MLPRFSAIAIGAVALLALTSCATKTESPPPTATPESPPPAASPSSAPAATPDLAPSGAGAYTPVVGSVLVPPVAVSATDGKVDLAYELQLINSRPQDHRLALNPLSGQFFYGTDIFAVADGPVVAVTPEPLRSNGLPFVFPNFRLDARAVDDAPADQLLVDQGGPVPTEHGFTGRDEAKVMPLDGDILRFVWSADQGRPR